MLPPPPGPRRDMGINIRFSAPDYERLKAIADYREVTVTALLHYVVIHSVLPRLEREVQLEQRQTPNHPALDLQLPTHLDLDRPTTNGSGLTQSVGKAPTEE